MASRLQGSAAKKWLINEWYEISNLSGNSDFVEDLFIDSVAMDRDGEVFEYFTGTPNGYPQIQIIPSHRIDSCGLPDGELKEGKFKGSFYFHEDGIVYSKDNQRPVAYVFCDENGKFSKFIDAAFIKHEFEKLWPEQKRGLPLFYHSLNSLRDILQSEEWERMNLLSMSSLNYTVENESGGPDTEEPDYVPAENCGELAVQYLQGGRIMYAKAGSGEKITQHQNFRPGNPWHEFYDMQARQALMGAGFPQSFWKPTGQGTAERNDIGKMCRMIDDRQAKMGKIFRWRITKAIAWAMANDRLPKSADWYSWGYTKPAKLTIDDGRTSKERIEKFKAGIINATDMIGEEGKSFDENLIERGEEIAKRELNRKAMEEKYGIEIDPRYYLMLTPNEMAPKEEQPTTQTNEPDSN
jgi:Phage portal protein, lambda family